MFSLAVIFENDIIAFGYLENIARQSKITQLYSQAKYFLNSETNDAFQMTDTSPTLPNLLKQPPQPASLPPLSAPSAPRR